MTDLLEHLRQEVLLCDGAMGSRVQQADLDIEIDYWGQENCTEILNLSRPDIVREIQAGFVAAGSDILLTNTFGGSPITLAEFDLQDKTHEINKRAGELAREALGEFHRDGISRYVLGDIGPGTKLPSLGQIDYDELEAALAAQSAGLLAGGVDGIMIETVQDILQLKAAVNGARMAMAEAGRQVPLLTQITVETTGTMLVGTDIAGAATVINALGIDVMGLNCATGPREMAEHVRWLSEQWPGLITVQPNAGLPELVDGKPSYPLAAEELADWTRRFVIEDGVNLIGGCCGTITTHIKAMSEMLEALAKEQGQGRRPKPTARQPEWVPGIASLYGQIPYRQENAYLSIGERCNANGSKKFREFQDAEDWDGCVAMGREQAKEGSHALDLCTAFVGRDELADMSAMVSRMRGAVHAPLVIDSTEYPILEGALKLYGGKALINSINFEDGEEPAAKRLQLARKFGCGVIALTIDEVGMAKTTAEKVKLAHRLHDYAVNEHGLASEDLLFDPLTFTICTGNEDDRRLGLETLDAIEQIAKELPRCQIILGLSNISFGLKPAARHVLNSVYLQHALDRGMTGAIVHLSKILPLHSIPEEEVKAAEDLIYDRRREGYDPLHAFIALYQDRTAAKVKKERPKEVEERLKLRIIDGDRPGLEEDLDEAMEGHPPLEIVNDILLGGMKVVGELFGSGQMQLPFVLQSAETMKASVAYLEPHMERSADSEKGTIVLATVKGDVHDIGKNLVDIILTNNGYRVVNIGIKQPIGAIIEAAKEHKADAIGMSGLLVKSTTIMRDNLEELCRQQISLPVMLGGAALTRNFVEEDCALAYEGASRRVAYARDAFDGLDLMAKVTEGGFDDYITERDSKREGRPTNQRRKLGQPTLMPRPLDLEEVKTRREELHKGVEVPTAPFLGHRIIEQVGIKSLLPYLNERMLYQFHWGYRKAGRSLADYMKWARTEIKPIMVDLVARCEAEEILHPQAVYGYFPAASEGDDLVLYGPDGGEEVARFALPRQNRSGGLCIADFFREADSGERDIIALQAVTVGQHASEVAREWFDNDKYQDYLYLHGLGVEMAEAMAEYVHKRVRGELGFGDKDARDNDALLNQGYQGSRYSFGYPACPTMSDQRKILELLDADRINLVMGDEDQLHPEQSTSAIIVHHPQAKYFSV
ncbi:MAG: methionine synthase [Rhodospirillaceae bacterium]|jgi:5-methyltetrahydrofolate--homocysteine methyltransferase|nr:methionine synthase [Rhodospirillaceae bacterium]MBT4690498.1 methionine synthase [Rhodospirillaceae bacterium]MBT5083216.1 methionine synthase [Rhodospirillaceae bacterium]MBT5526519.1 methionine synthase [Rhodospirillaceae bacterium]MBT5878288.1 methionine synthase [Rhodospirillaceae bacterium]